MDKVMGLGRTRAVSGGAGGVGAVMAAPSLLGAVGFTAAGITAGSYAAKMMSAAATANGGGVAAGGLVSILQSAGATGLSGTANAVVACVGGIIGAGTGFVASLFQDEEEKKRREEEKKKVFWVAAILVMWYVCLNGHDPLAIAIAAAASVVAVAGWLAKVCWEERERKRREEEKLMWGTAALAFASCVYFNSRQRKQRAE